MNYVGLFEGISGFGLAFKRAGATIKAVCEINKDCQKVLRRHHPEAELIGDVKTIQKDTFNGESITVLAGGFPCQDLSVAGRRKGLDGERSGLWWEMVRVVKDHRPRWWIWENVPGLLSSNNGKDFEIILEATAECGYHIDVSILDAQYFGVAQRRRRLFAVCQRIEDLRSEKTISSAKTIGRCLIEILLTILAEARFPLTTELKSLDFPKYLCADGLKKRISLFGITTKEDWNGLFKHWVETAMSFLPEQTNSALLSDVMLKCESTNHISASGSSKTESEKLLGSIYQQWSSLWDESFVSLNASTISTRLKQTTESKISTCAEIVAIINLFIAHLSDSSLNFSQEASFALTATWVFTNYARQAVSDLFTGYDLVRIYDDYLVRVGRSKVGQLIQRVRAERGEQVFSFSEGSAWDSPPRRETGQGVAGTLNARTSAGDGLGTDFECSGGLQPFGLIGNGEYAERPATLRAKGGDCGGGSEHLIAGTVSSKRAKGTGGPSGDECQNLVVAPTLRANGDAHSGFTGADGLVIEPQITHTLCGEGFDASEDGTGRGTPLVTMAFAQNTRDELRYINGDGQIAGDLAAEAGMKQQSYVMAFRAAGQEGFTPSEIAPPIASTNGGGAGVPTIAFSERTRAEGRTLEAQDELAYALTNPGSGGRTHSRQIAGQFGVRRLTPLECERLQGFPDEWTKWGDDGKQISDSARYRMLGNAVCVPTAEWIARRIARLEVS